MNNYKDRITYIKNFDGRSLIGEKVDIIFQDLKKRFNTTFYNYPIAHIELPHFYMLSAYVNYQIDGDCKKEMTILDAYLVDYMCDRQTKYLTYSEFYDEERVRKLKVVRNYIIDLEKGKNVEEAQLLMKESLERPYIVLVFEAFTFTSYINLPYLE